MFIRMKLIDYLKSENETVAAFAERLGEPETTIRKIAYGQRQPSLPLSVKITAATSGLVPAEDMVIPVEPATHPNKQEAA